MHYRFLIVDGNQGKDLLPLLGTALPENAIDVTITADCIDALRLLTEKNAAVVFFDMCLPGINGIEFLNKAKSIDHTLSIIMTTTCGNINDTIETIKHGAFDYLIMPPKPSIFKDIVRKALECNVLNRRVRYVQSGSHIDSPAIGEDLMVGSSPKLMEIWKLVGRIADNDAAVLIMGESGTGKELLARAIYNHSSRRGKPFLAINCAAMPETLLESELFGHEKGAFTDAHQRRIGKFEHCNGGTILLDEIGEMSHSSQSKLLRVLENQEFERIGGNETIRTDVRVIASTNCSLEESVHAKQFRLDLYHRLKGITITLPPLRERQEDIPILVDLFCRTFANKYGKLVQGVSPKAMDLILQSRWEGNIRELRNVIGSAVAVADGDILRIEDFYRVMPDYMNQPVAPGNDYYAYFVRLLEPKVSTVHPDSIEGLYQDICSGLEKAAVELALRKSGKNQVMAAKMLGISRNTLRNRIERYGLDSETAII